MKKLIIIFVLFLFCFNVSACELIGVSVGGTSINGDTGEDLLMPLGDSITLGSGNAGTWYGYRDYLQDELGIGTYDFVGSYKSPSSSGTYDVDHSGIGGDDSQRVINRLPAELIASLQNASISSKVLLMIGTNDYAAGLAPFPSTSVSNIENIISMIDTFNPNIEVYVALIIPTKTGASWPVTLNTSLKPMLETYQESKSNLYIVDMYSAFINDTFGLCAEVTSTEDGNCFHPLENLHPSLMGYKTMALQWAACIKNPAATNCNGN